MLVATTSTFRRRTRLMRRISPAHQLVALDRRGWRYTTVEHAGLTAGEGRPIGVSRPLMRSTPNTAMLASTACSPPILQQIKNRPSSVIARF